MLTKDIVSFEEPGPDLFPDHSNPGQTAANREKSTIGNIEFTYFWMRSLASVEIGNSGGNMSVSRQFITFL